MSDFRQLSALNDYSILTLAIRIASAHLAISRAIVFDSCSGVPPT